MTKILADVGSAKLLVLNGVYQSAVPPKTSLLKPKKKTPLQETRVRFREGIVLPSQTIELKKENQGWGPPPDGDWSTRK